MRSKLRPEYFFRPSQNLIRLMSTPKTSPALMRLAWGDQIWVETEDVIGKKIWKRGVFDTSAAECLARLVGAGDVVYDVGANIGQMTNISCRRAGPRGKVVAFEPHPDIYAELCKNADLWTGGGAIVPLQRAISNQAGELALHIGSDFKENRGASSLSTTEGPATEGGRKVMVQVDTLDTYFAEEPKVDVIKLDIEFHELEALQGASQALSEGKVREVLFESHCGYPSPVSTLLEGYGFTIFGVIAKFSGVSLVPGSEARVPDFVISHNYIATRDPKRTQAQFNGGGWLVLKKGLQK